ncbi:hypothetical protein MTBBW1_300057 [Desulfamplus magnetovallimortis]|uniref:Uncharacterized protein n=1 Tax=Desulfamplus magnetovallimortis TaxID=1246637 RepID=A0A1W1HFW3_9BACT|nr:hypothetical protein MTBBW1_300057 [Desulfamplus magnetovallimortis]
MIARISQLVILPLHLTGINPHDSEDITTMHEKAFSNNNESSDK